MGIGTAGISSQEGLEIPRHVFHFLLRARDALIGPRGNVESFNYQNVQLCPFQWGIQPNQSAIGERDFLHTATNHPSIRWWIDADFTSVLLKGISISSRPPAEAVVVRLPIRSSVSW
jgi:hypothetical protein